jgi:7-cyano-7-deazaguanine synthase
MTGPHRAVVLFSGGLDSTTTLAIAVRVHGYACHALTLDYGQRHRAELRAAERLARRYGACDHAVIRVDLGRLGHSALTDSGRAVPTGGEGEGGIPVTYVPARNTVFLALALGWAETLEAQRILIGVNAVDYSGYPDCRPAFIAAFEELATLATKVGVEGHPIRIEAPLLHWSKAEIIRRGVALGVDYADTVSCYDADRAGRACGDCDACRIRRLGFLEAGIPDPTRYRKRPPARVRSG